MSATTFPLSKSGDLVDVTYHSMEDGVLGGVEKVSSTWTMHVHHMHPTSSKTVELFTTALKERNLPQAAAIIDAIGVCSTRIACSTGRGGPYEKVDAVTIQKIAQDDSELQKMLLKLYQKALMSE